MSDAGSEWRDRTVLVVEDAEAIRKMVCSMLSQTGYRTLEAEDGAEALRIVQENSDRIHLVLTDMIMPKMTGPELARNLATIRPELRILFMSGYSDDPVVRHVERTSLFLPKPFTASALNEKIRQALERPWTGLPEVTNGSTPQ